MHHIDDHTLELYVLGAKSIEDKRSEIEAHLQACEHCNAYVAKVDGFYTKLDENLQEEQQPRSSSAVTRLPAEVRRTQAGRRNDELAPVFYNDAPPVPYQPTTKIEKFRYAYRRAGYFVRRHPIAAGTATFAVLAGAVMLFYTTSTFFKGDKNPQYINYNTTERRVEILDRKYEKLLSFPCDGVENMKGEFSKGWRQEIAVFDLDGDGKNEIISAVPLPEDGALQGHPLRILDGNGTTKQRLSLNREIHYLQRTYASVWGAGMFVIDSTNRTDPFILISWGGGRSPVVITRLNRKLETVGEYWHFGGIRGMRLLDLNEDGKPELIVSGINEALDSVRGEFPAFAVLDPSKIVGSGKSTATAGFAMPESQAELFYVGLPVSSISAILDQRETVRGITNVGPKLFSCWVDGATYLRETISFEYVFSQDMKPLEVKSANQTDYVYHQLAKEVKVSEKINATYLENLKNGIRYWNGTEWRKEVVRVQHNSEVAVSR